MPSILVWLSTFSLVAHFVFANLWHVMHTCLLHMSYYRFISWWRYFTISADFSCHFRRSMVQSYDFFTELAELII